MGNRKAAVFWILQIIFSFHILRLHSFFTFFVLLLPYKSMLLSFELKIL